MMQPVLIAALICAGLLATAAPGADSPGQTNLFALPSVSAYSGSLSGAELKTVVSGEGKLRRIQMLPHLLEVTWETPVIANTFQVQWDSDEVYGLHYGLEYWDAPSECFKLAFEETANTAQVRTHRFPDIRTSRVRFTVFAHPVKYSSVIIRSLRLSAEPGPVLP